MIRLRLKKSIKKAMLIALLIAMTILIYRTTGNSSSNLEQIKWIIIFSLIGSTIILEN
jgi:hypothetical protein